MMLFQYNIPAQSKLILFSHKSDPAQSKIMLIKYISGPAQLKKDAFSIRSGSIKNNAVSI
jgi:hypothetical protein